MSKLSDPKHAQVKSDQDGFSAEQYEQSNVHSVYESIASHFSDTRYKPWPLIPAFLNSLPSGSIGADLGCGNGKYLSLRSVVMGRVDQEGIKSGNDIITLGLDRSSNLIDLARNNVVLGERVLQGHQHQQQHQEDGDSISSSSPTRCTRNEVGVGDAIQSFYRSKCVDYALSIATIHHFSTPQRRMEAVKELIRIVRPVSFKEHSQQLKQKQEQFLANKDSTANYSFIAQQTTGRFLIYVWALEQRGESRRKFESIAKEKDEKGRDLLVPWVQKSLKEDEEKVFQRYYHVFEQGELESLVADAASQMSKVNVVLELSGWEKGNWYGIWQCVEME